MDHQPFEDWIFEQNKITEEENKKLRNHILECDQCTDLRTSWAQVESILIDAPMAAPMPGFSKRFAANMVVKKHQEQQKQSIRYLLIVGLVLLFITLLLLSSLFFSYSAGEIIIGATSAITGFIQRFINLRSMIYQFVYNIPPLVVVAVWLIIAVWGLVMTPLWGVTVWRVSKLGVGQK
jgi:hypothetical protein